MLNKTEGETDIYTKIVNKNTRVLRYRNSANSTNENFTSTIDYHLKNSSNLDI